MLAMILAAHADTIMLDTGATVEGDLARYEFGGDCQISVTEGGLLGAIVIVPCHRVESFVRTSQRVPVPIGIETSPVPLELHAELPTVVVADDESPALFEDSVVEAADEPIIPDDPIAPAEIAPPMTTTGPTTLPGAPRSVRF